MVFSELEKRGIHMTVERLTLNPLRGLVAKGVQIKPASDRGCAVASINEVVLDINYSNLVHGEPFLNAVELHNATLALPTDTPEPPRKGEWLEISHLNARVLLAPHQLTLEQGEAMIHGLRVSASGHFVNPEKLQWSQSPKASTDKESPLVSVQKALQTLDELKMAGGRPALKVSFSGDLANPSQVFVEAAFQSGKFSVDGVYPVESIQIVATLADGLVRVDQCSVKDAKGALDASGSFLLATGEADMRVRSTLDLPGLIRAARPSTSALNELTFYSPPSLEMSGKARFHKPQPGSQESLLSASGDIPGRPKFYGRLSVGRFAVRSVIFEGAGTDFSWNGASWYLHDTRIRHRDGDIVLNAMQSPEGFRFNLDSRINPGLFLPLLPPVAAAKLGEWEFLAAPVLHLEGLGPKPSLETLEITGKAKLGATRARGVALNGVSVDLGFKANVLTCQNIKLERPEGTGAGTVVYDFNTDELQFRRVKTTLNPVEIVSIFDRDLSEQLVPYRFKVRPALLVDGKVGCRRGDFARNRLRVEVDGANGMEYTFLKKNLSANKITGTVTILVDRLKLDGLDASIFGGHLRGKADISILKAKGDYTAELNTMDVNFPALTKLYFDYDTSKGKLNSTFLFSGRHDLVRAITGTGNLVVTDGNVFAIPIFGPFSSILDDLLPGTGYNDARKGTCTFEMRDGIVTTNDLVMEGKGFSIYGEGKLFVAEDKMDFSARINAQGITGKLLSPVSHLLEYVSDGSLSKPVWRPKRLPKIIFSPRSAPSPPPVGAQ